MESEESKTIVGAAPQSIEDSGNQNFSSQPHPLLIPEVVRKVLKHVSKSSLLECRTLCHAWNEEATFHLRKHPSTIIFIPPLGQLFPDDLESYNVEQLKDLKKCIDQSWNWPVTKLKYFGFHPKFNKNREFSNAVRSAFKSISPWVTELTIDHEKDMLSTYVLLPKIQLPALNELYLKFSTELLSHNKSVKQLLHQVLKNAPELQTIDIYECSGSTFGAKTNSLLLPIIKSSGLKSLSCITVCAYSGNTELIQVGELAHIGIQKLELKISHIEENFESVLNAMLTKLARSLVELGFWFHKPEVAPSITHLLINLPKLSKLEKFELNSFRCNVQMLPCPGFSYDEILPKLKVLSIDIEKASSFLAKGCTTLQELKVYGVEPCEFLNNGPNMFPNVKCLKIPLCHLRTVCSHWTQLEKFKLVDWQYANHYGLNFVLTGLDVGTWLNFSSRIENGEPLESIQREYSTMDTTLTRLKKLKVLKLNCVPKDAPLPISWLTCELLFLKMESLQCLDFCGNRLNSVEITNDVLDHMRKKFRVFYGRDNDPNDLFENV